MRRKDREVTDPEKIREIISSCNCCRLGIPCQTGVYVVPMSFGYQELQGTYVFYFHSAKEGRKIELLHQNPLVGFEMDTNYQLKKSESPCGYSARFQSIIGTGTVSFLEDLQQKSEALSILMHHYTKQSNWEFPETMLQAVCVFCLTVDTLSCKEHE